MITPSPHSKSSLICSPQIKFREDGYVSNWFSNMLKLDEPYVHDGITYFTSENFYQAMKIDASRRELRVEIAAMNPHKSKTCFRRDPERYKVRDDWDSAEKLRVMRQILEFKFAPNTSWHKLLLETGDDEIIEYNNWNDTFWGVDIRKETGTNHLGKMLMEMRAAFVRPNLDSFMS